MQEDIHTWSASRIAERVRSGRVSATEVARQVLDRIERVDPLVNAYATVDRQAGLAAAAEIDRRVARGEPVGPLAGVPFSVKDLVATAGMETAYGSHVYAGNVPAQDAQAVARLRAAGAVLLGKTTTPEFGHKALTSSPRHGHTRNPWAFGLSPGGSSGGATVAVATGMAPLALTTDGSGSARIPAAVCGVLGLKPTLGRIPHENAAELFTNFICLGLSSRTTLDLALALGVTAGPFAGDPWSRHAACVDYLPFATTPGPLAGRRVLLVEKMGNQRVSRAVRDGLERMASLLEGEGAIVTRLQDALSPGRETMVTMMRAYQNVRLRPLLAQHADAIDPSLREALAEGAGQSAQDVQRAPADRSALYRRVEELFAGCDLMLTPTVSAEPPRVDHAHDAPFVIDGETVGPLRSEWYCYTGLFNLTGHPAISIPVGMDGGGVPVGVQLVAPWWGEPQLIEVAATVERLLPWGQHWPALDGGGGGPLPYPAPGRPTSSNR